MSTEDRLARLGLTHLVDAVNLRQSIEKIGLGVRTRQEQFKLFLMERDALIQAEPAKADFYRREAARIWKEYVELLRDSERQHQEDLEFEEDRPLSHRGPSLLHALSLMGTARLRQLNFAEEILKETITQQILPMFSQGICDSVVVQRAANFFKGRLEALEINRGEMAGETATDVGDENVDVIGDISSLVSRCRGVGYKLLIARRVVILRALGFVGSREVDAMIGDIETRDHREIGDCYPPKELEALAIKLISP